MDRLTSMAVFVKAAELGSFAATGTALELSGPMVGKHVRFLEQLLGVQLINRTTRRQSLTEFGRAYYERCRAILAEVEASEALAADQLTAPRGKLRVTMPVHFGRHCVMPVLLDLGRRFPGLDFDMSFNDRLIDLADDRYDLAIRTGTLEAVGGLVARRVARQQMVVCASPAHLEQHGVPRTLEDLERHEAVLYHRSGPVAPWLFPVPGAAPAEVRPPGRHRFDDLDAIASAAVRGAGIAWLPLWLVRDRVADGSLVQVLTDRAPFLYDCHAVWQHTPHLPLKLRVAVDVLARELPKMLG